MIERLSNERIEDLIIQLTNGAPWVFAEDAKALIAEVREWRAQGQVQPWVDVVTEINKFAIEQRSIYPENWAKGP